MRRNRDCHRIAIYNHKGGVGKTTLTVHIAFALGLLGYKVLLVDSDPQCNLTSFLVEGDVLDDLLDKSDSDGGRTIWSALKPIHEAAGDVFVVQPLERGKNVYLIPGDIRLSEFENGLSEIWTDCLQRRVRGYRGIAALSSLVNKVATEHEFDYVFYDAGPNIGPLNKVILLDCDHFIIPAACDLFSIRALKTLGHTLSDWIQSWKGIFEFAPDGIYLMPGKPRLLGYIPQRFKVYGGKPSQAFIDNLGELEKHVSSEIISVIRKVDPSLVKLRLHELKLGEIKDYGALATEAQTQGRPMWRVKGKTPAQREKVKEDFAAVAKKLTELIAKE